MCIKFNLMMCGHSFAFFNYLALFMVINLALPLEVFPIMEKHQGSIIHRIHPEFRVFNYTLDPDLWAVGYPMGVLVSRS